MESDSFVSIRFFFSLISLESLVLDWLLHEEHFLQLFRGLLQLGQINHCRTTMYKIHLCSHFCSLAVFGHNVCCTNMYSLCTINSKSKYPSPEIMSGYILHLASCPLTLAYYHRTVSKQYSLLTIVTV
jgi:hypothetical protein